MKLFSQEMECEIIDKKIYTKGGRAMRLIGSTKYGYKSFLTPIEIDQERYNKNKRFLEEYETMSTDYSDDFFILPEMEEEPDLLEHMIGYISDQCYKITFDDKLLKQAVNNSEKKIAVNAGNSSQIESLGKLILENIAAFKPWVEDYHQWLVVAIKMVVANLPYEYFRAVSSQSAKFEESKCRQKWQNIVSSYAEQPKDINQIMFFMKNNVSMCS